MPVASPLGTEISVETTLRNFTAAEAHAAAPMLCLTFWGLASALVWRVLLCSGAGDASAPPPTSLLLSLVVSATARSLHTWGLVGEDARLPSSDMELMPRTCSSLTGQQQLGDTKHVVGAWTGSTPFTLTRGLSLTQIFATEWTQVSVLAP